MSQYQFDQRFVVVEDSFIAGPRAVPDSVVGALGIALGAEQIKQLVRVEDRLRLGVLDDRIIFVDLVADGWDMATSLIELPLSSVTRVEAFFPASPSSEWLYQQGRPRTGVRGRVTGAFDVSTGLVQSLRSLV